MISDYLEINLTTLVWVKPEKWTEIQDVTANPHLAKIWSTKVFALAPERTALYISIILSFVICWFLWDKRIDHYYLCHCATWIVLNEATVRRFSDRKKIPYKLCFFVLFHQPEPFPNLLLGVVGVRGQEDDVLLCQLVTSLVPLVKPDRDSIHYILYF